MSESPVPTKIADLLKKAGITVNGSRPQDIQVHNRNLFSRVLRSGSLGLGEAYLEGWWDCNQLDEFFHHIFRARLDQHFSYSPALLWLVLQTFFTNPQRVSKAFVIGEHHYDISFDVYQAMLGSTLAYTCAYWQNADTLNQAQENKLDLVCRKLGLKPGMRLLDIGCGWGSLALHAARHYGTEVVGVTVSKEQQKVAQSLIKDLPIEIKLQDYRDITGKFDRVASVGMFEAVGYKNYPTFMRIARRCLKQDGLFLLHTIGSNMSSTTGDPWMSKYIFPRGSLPSIKQIGAAIESFFVMEDWHNFGAHYDRTLMTWFHNFDTAWSDLKQKTNLDQRFYRMWTYYLLSCAGAFRARNLQLWQIVLSPEGVPGGHTSIRPTLK